MLTKPPPQTQASARTLRWVTGPAGGGWHSLNQAICAHIEQAVPGLKIEVVAGGGRDNPTLLQQGAAEFATSVDHLCAAASKGSDPYAGNVHTKLRCIGVGWSPLPFHVVHTRHVTPDLAAAIRSGKLRIAVPPPATSDELTFRRVLAFYGTDYGKLDAGGSLVFHGSYEAIVEAFAAGAVDYVFGATTMPAQAIDAMGLARRGGKLAPLAADLMTCLCRSFGYGQGEIPADTYPLMQEAPIRTTFMETVFLVSADVPESTVWLVTKALIASGAHGAIHPALKQFSPATACAGVPVPLHLGAARAYREAGLMQGGRIL